MKRLFLFLFVASFMMACTGGQKAETNQEETTEQAVEVTVGNFKEKAADLAGKLVTIKGTADHICRGDGRKMFLIDVEMPGRVKVVPNEDMAAFNSEQEGLDFIVTGIIEETYIDEAYLQEWEEEIKAGVDETKHLGGGEPMTDEEKEAGKHLDDPASEQIAGYRQMMADQGTDKLFFYSIVCTSYEVIEE